MDTAEHATTYILCVPGMHYNLTLQTVHNPPLPSPPLNYTTLTTLHFTPHYTTLHYTLHYIHCTVLHYIHCTAVLLHYTTLHYTTIHYTTQYTHYRKKMCIINKRAWATDAQCCRFYLCCANQHDSTQARCLSRLMIGVYVDSAYR